MSPTNPKLTAPTLPKAAQPTSVKQPPVRPKLTTPAKPGTMDTFVLYHANGKLVGISDLETQITIPVFQTGLNTYAFALDTGDLVYFKVAPSVSGATKQPFAGMTRWEAGAAECIEGKPEVEVRASGKSNEQNIGADQLATIEVGALLASGDNSDGKSTKTKSSALLAPQEPVLSLLNGGAQTVLGDSTVVSLPLGTDATKTSIVVAQIIWTGEPSEPSSTTPAPHSSKAAVTSSKNSNSPFVADLETSSSGKSANGSNDVKNTNSLPLVSATHSPTYPYVDTAPSVRRTAFVSSVGIATYVNGSDYTTATEDNQAPRNSTFVGSVHVLPNYNDVDPYSAPGNFDLAPTDSEATLTLAYGEPVFSGTTSYPSFATADSGEHHSSLFAALTDSDPTLTAEYAPTLGDSAGEALPIPPTMPFVIRSEAGTSFASNRYEVGRTSDGRNEGGHREGSGGGSGGQQAGYGAQQEEPNTAPQDPAVENPSSFAQV